MLFQAVATPPCSAGTSRELHPRTFHARGYPAGRTSWAQDRESRRRNGFHQLNQKVVHFFFSRCSRSRLHLEICKLACVLWALLRHYTAYQGKDQDYKDRGKSLCFFNFSIEFVFHPVTPFIWLLHSVNFLP